MVYQYLTSQGAAMQLRLLNCSTMRHVVTALQNLPTSMLTRIWELLRATM